MKWILSFCLFSSAAHAEICPATADHSVRQSEIIAELQALRGPARAGPLAQELWALWTDAPDAKAQRLLDDGMEKLARANFPDARDALDALIAYCPDYAEGYNQRAFSNYLQQDFASALVDLDRAIEITPNHVAALAGRGLTLLGLGRDDDAQAALKAAVALNPWLSERALIREPEGTDI